MKKLYFLSILLISAVSYGQVLEENFDYGMTGGDLTSASGGLWVQHSGSADPVAYVPTPSLTMTDYPSSGIGGHVSFSGTSQDVNRAFSGISTGTVYGSALVNLSAVGSGNYFMHFNASGGFRTRVGAQDDGNGDILFGIGTSSSTLTYGTTPYSLNTTYLLVFSYEIATGVSNLYVLTAVTPTEPMTPEATNTGTSGTAITAIAFRQSSGIPAVLVDGVRVAENWNEIMNNSTNPSISITSPANGSTLAPGTTSVDVEWTTANLSGGETVSVTVNGNTSTNETSPFNIVTMDGESYDVTVELIDGGPIDSDMITFDVASLTQVMTIADLRAGTIGEIYELTGEAVISYIVTEGNRNQKYIQDATGGILIDDVPGTLSTAFNIGDGITGLQGELSSFSGLLQFNPVANNTASSTGNTITPVEITAGELLTNGENYESELITVLNVDFAVTGTFTDNTNYDITTAGGSDTTVCRVAFGDENLIGANIPTSTSAVTGLGGEFNGTYQVLPRYLTDVLGATLSNDNFNVSEFSIYPNPTTNGKVTISSTNSEAISVVGFDILGKEVLSSQVSNNTLDVSDLKTGVYILKISQDNATVTRKLIIK